MRRSRVQAALAVAVVLAAAAVLGGFRVSAQQARQVFVSVTDSRGVPILNLGPDSFKVFENQTLGRTIKVEPVDWPMKLTVLVDNGTGTSDYLANLRTALRNFFNEIPDD